MNANETKEKLTSTSAYIVQRTVTYTYTDVYICNSTVRYGTDTVRCQIRTHYCIKNLKYS